MQINTKTNSSLWKFSMRHVSRPIATSERWRTQPTPPPPPPARSPADSPARRPRASRPASSSLQAGNLRPLSPSKFQVTPSKPVNSTARARPEWPQVFLGQSTDKRMARFCPNATVSCVFQMADRNRGNLERRASCVREFIRVVLSCFMQRENTAREKRVSPYAICAVLDLPKGK